VIVEDVGDPEREKRGPDDIRKEMAAGRHAPEPQRESRDDPRGEREPGPRGARAAPDPPSRSKEEPDRAVPAREGSAPLPGGHEGWDVTTGARELGDVPRSRPTPVVLEDDVHHEPGADHDAQEEEGSVPPQPVPTSQRSQAERREAQEHDPFAVPARGRVARQGSGIPTISTLEPGTTSRRFPSSNRTQHLVPPS
jgi:hypothetical protein